MLPCWNRLYVLGMMRRLVISILSGTLAGPALGADPDPCRLLTAAEISSALGSAPKGGKADGPDLDRELAARSWTCSQQVGKSFLSVSVVEFASTAGAAKGMKMMLKEAKDMPDAIKLAPEKGVGEQAVWGASADGAMWIALKGKYMLNVTLAGQLANPQRLREPLKQLATQALGRLTP
jgi:hypothetical protein